MVEVVIASGLAVFILLGAVNVLSFMKVQEKKLEMLSESSISGSLGNRFLWIHFKSSTPSFNLLRGPSFADDQGRQFYDYCPDYSSAEFPGDLGKRTVTLTPTGRTSFMVMVLDSQVKDVANGHNNVMFADPASFFDISGNSGSLSKDKLIAYFAAQNPKVLDSPGLVSLINFYSPAVVRPLSKLDDSPPAMPSPIGMIVKYAAKDFAVETFGGLLQYQNALTETPQSSLEQFIRELPAASGGIPPFMIRSVRLLKYDIVKLDAGLDKPRYDLVFSEWDGGQWARPNVVATDVKKLTLSRADITDVLVSVQLEINEEK